MATISELDISLRKFNYENFELWIEFNSFFERDYNLKQAKSRWYTFMLFYHGIKKYDITNFSRYLKDERVFAKKIISQICKAEITFNLNIYVIPEGDKELFKKNYKSMELWIYTNEKNNSIAAEPLKRLPDYNKTLPIPSRKENLIICLLNFMRNIYSKLLHKNRKINYQEYYLPNIQFFEDKNNQMQEQGQKLKRKESQTSTV
jgi:hypothetical protein